MLRSTQLVPQQVVPGAQHVTPPHVTVFGGHRQWHVAGSNTNGGLHPGTHWPESEQTTVPVGQAHMPV